MPVVSSMPVKGSRVYIVAFFTFLVPFFAVALRPDKAFPLEYTRITGNITLSSYEL